MVQPPLAGPRCYAVRALCGLRCGMVLEQINLRTAIKARQVFQRAGEGWTLISRVGPALDETREPGAHAAPFRHQGAAATRACLLLWALSAATLVLAPVASKACDE